MSLLERFGKFSIFIALVLVLVLALAGVFAAINMGAFHGLIEAKVSEITGSPAQLGPIRLALRFPPHVTIEKSSIEVAGMLIEWQQLSLDLVTVVPPYDVRVNLLRPKISGRPGGGANAPVATKAPGNGGGNSGGAVRAPPVRLSIRVQDGEVRMPEGQVSGLELTFQQHLLLSSAASLHLKGQARVRVLPMPFAVTVDTDSLTLSPQSIKASDLKATVAGLTAQLQGASLLSEQRHRWLLKIEAPDLARVPTPPAFVPGKDWKGSVSVAAELNKDSGLAGWRAEGHVQLTGVSATLALKQDGATVEGPVKLELKTAFNYADQKGELREMQGQVDLTSAWVQYRDWLNKVAGVPLTLRLNLTGDTTMLELREVEGQLAQVHASVSGRAGLESPYDSDLKVVVPKATLADLDQVLLPLKASPVRGELAIEGQVRGPLADIGKTLIRVDSMILKSFAAQIKYAKPGVVQVSGNIAANLSAQGEMAGGEIKSVQARGSADLKGASFVLGPLKKAAGQDLGFEFNLANRGKDLSVDKFDVSGFLGRLSLRGTLSNPLEPRVNLVIAANPVDLSELRVAAPPWHELLPKGEVRGHLKLVGVIAPEKTWPNWSLDVDGDVTALLPEFKMATVTVPAQSVPQPVAKEEKAPPPEPLLPKGRLTERARLRVAVDVGTFTKDSLVIKGVSAHGAYAAGHFQGDAAVARIFGGSASVNRLDFPLFDLHPVIQGTARWQGIIIEEALAFAKPAYKDMAKGKTEGMAEFSTLLPAETDFLKALKARGDFRADPLTLNSLKVGEMVNDLLKKAPMLKVPPVKVQPLHGDLRGKFDLASQVVQLNDVVGRDVDGSELQIKGNLTLSNMQCDMIGTFFWAGSPLKGCIAEGNSDPRGRLVLPLAIKGDLMKPGLSLLTDLMARLAGKTLECEGKKAAEKLKHQGADAIKKEAEKALKGLFGH